MKTYLTYGGAMAVAGAIMTLGLYLLGFHSDAAKLGTAQTVGIVGGLGIAITCLVLGTKARLAETPPNQNFGYGRALVAGVMISLFASLFGIVTNFAYFQIINPGFSDVLVQAEVAKLAAKGMSDAQIEQAEKFMRMFMRPAAQVVFGFIGGMVSGTVISLVTAAFLRRSAGDGDGDALPPPLS